jgi:hypothetical protein
MFRFSLVSLLFIFTQRCTFAETYCFNSDVSLNEVRSYLEVMLTPNDKVAQEGANCLEVTVSVNRTPLIYKWLKKKYPVRSQNRRRRSNQENGVTKNCRLQVERLSRGKAVIDESSIGKGTRINKTTQRSSAKSLSSLLLGQGFSGAIRVNDRQVFLTCKSGGNGFYTIQVSLSEQNSSLSTIVQLRTGQKTNIGRIVEDLTNREKSLGLPSGIKLKKEQKDFIYDYFLIAQ